MLPQDLVQLGVAGVVAGLLLYLLKLILDGKLHTEAEIKIRDEYVRQLLGQIDTMTAALSASNEQSRAIISLWKALQHHDDTE